MGNKFLERADRVWGEQLHMRSLLDDVHDYILPFRRPKGRRSLRQAMDRVFDGTVISSAFRFAGRLQQDATPKDQPFFELKPGPLVQDRGERKRIGETFDQVSKLTSSIIDVADWHVGSQEMYLDLFAGQGATLILKSEDPSQVVNFVSVPNYEIALERGPWGQTMGIVWKKKWPAELIPEMFPQAEIPQELKDTIKSSPKRLIEVTQYTKRNPKMRARPWEHRAFVKGFDKLFDFQRFRTNPWLHPRFFAVPGEAQGVGLAHIALPFVKTVNKAREMALKAAAFSLLGQWMNIDDGVFNPDTARMAPGSFWTVGRTGGPLGPSIQRADIPHDFDIQSIIIQDEREQIKRASFDDDLPPIAGAVRSPTEIVERISKIDFDWGGIEGRLHKEIVQPLVQRTIDITEQVGILPTNLKIDQLFTSLDVQSPLSRARRAAAVRPTIEWIEILKAIGGPQYTALIARIEDLGADIGRDLGVKEDKIRSDDERRNLEALAAQIAGGGEGQVDPEAA